MSVFASGLTAAASWDRKLIYERAVALGEEFRAKGAHVHLGYVAHPVLDSSRERRLIVVRTQDPPRAQWVAMRWADEIGRASVPTRTSLASQ